MQLVRLVDADPEREGVRARDGLDELVERVHVDARDDLLRAVVHLELRALELHEHDGRVRRVHRDEPEASRLAHDVPVVEHLLEALDEEAERDALDRVQVERKFRVLLHFLGFSFCAALCRLSVGSSAGRLFP